MTAYRRNLVAGEAYFFTLNLADRRSSLLNGNIGLLRAAFLTRGIAIPSSCREPLSALEGEREGPARREGEVGGGGAKCVIGPLTLPSPPASGGEGITAGVHGGTFR